MARRGVFTQRDLPHWYVPNKLFFVTFRLAGTIPERVVRAWRQTRDARLRHAEKLPPEQADDVRDQAHRSFFRHLDRYLDAAAPGPRWLGEPEVGNVVAESLRFGDGARYRLGGYCVMPNHVHALIRPYDSGKNAAVSRTPDERPDGHSPLSSILHSIKSYTASRANAILGRSGSFWQHESYDRWIRDESELERVVYYIHHDPVRAGLVTRPADWPFSSAGAGVE